jgi:hypothetical protein
MITLMTIHDQSRHDRNTRRFDLSVHAFAITIAVGRT